MENGSLGAHREWHSLRLPQVAQELGPMDTVLRLPARDQEGHLHNQWANNAASRRWLQVRSRVAVVRLIGRFLLGNEPRCLVRQLMRRSAKRQKISDLDREETDEPRTHRNLRFCTSPS